MRSASTLATTVLALSLMALLRPAISDAHESPVDHVGRTLRMWVEGDRLHLEYRLQLTERAALLQLARIDTDRDGKISDAEREAFFAGFASQLAGRFHVQIDGRPLELQPDASVQLDPGLGQTYRFTAPIASLATGKHAGQFIDDYSRAYPGPYRWRQVPATNRVTILLPDPAATQPTQSHPDILVLDFELAVATP